jgi:predicted nucleotidyltransferase
VRPRRFTRDADVTVVLESLAEFEQLKDGLLRFGFERTRHTYRLSHKEGGWVDLLPYSGQLAPGGRLDLGPDLTLNMAGFNQILPSKLEVEVTPGLTVPVVGLPLYVLLKLVAFGDRGEQKDLASVLHCLRHYAEGEDRRYGLDFGGVPIPYEQTTAYLLGHDGRRFHDPPLVTAITRVLDQFTTQDSVIVFRVAREDGGVRAEAEQRSQVFELFRWFRAGAGV